MWEKWKCWEKNAKILMFSDLSTIWIKWEKEKWTDKKLRVPRKEWEKKNIETAKGRSSVKEV